MLDTYAVMGHPVDHSLSPIIHAQFAAQTSQQLQYRAVHVLPGNLADEIRVFRKGGGKGLNITLPFKEEAWRLCQVCTARADQAGAVNTMRFEHRGQVWGDNTDGVGLVRDLTRNLGVAIANRRVLVLGAGGAVRGILAPLLAAGPARLVVANRNAARAAALVEHFASHAQLVASDFCHLAGDSFDLVINGTSASLHGSVPEVPDTVLAHGACCYDLAYGRDPTPFVRWGRSRGANIAVDGLGMLVEQAAESFHLWRGVRPDPTPVIAGLRREMRARGASDREPPSQA